MNNDILRNTMVTLYEVNNSNSKQHVIVTCESVNSVSDTRIIMYVIVCIGYSVCVCIIDIKKLSLC